MEDTDIYKTREAMPNRSGSAPRRRRRTRSENTAEEEGSRRRRSSNSGLRRLLHLARKPKHQRNLWISVGVIMVLLLLGAAIWEFVIVEQNARTAERDNEYVRKSSSSPAAVESESE